MVKVKYIGKHPDDPECKGFIPGVPLTDHEVETEKEARELVASGLYKIDKGKED